jgi:hypothetical protein
MTSRKIPNSSHRQIDLREVQTRKFKTEFFSKYQFLKIGAKIKTN